MLTLGIVEAALELVPSAIVNHPTVVATGRARGKPPQHTLLDEGIHFAAMKTLPNAEKRGRPDILHRSLLAALDSILAREKLLSIFVSTYNNEIIEINPQTRLPRRFTRFTGLMEQLLVSTRVPPHGPILMQLRRRSLANHIQRIKPSHTYLLTEKGTPTPPDAFARKLIATPTPLVLVGGFAHGDLTLTTKQLADQEVSLYPDPLPTSTTISMTLHSVETLMRLSTQRFAKE